MGGDSLFAPDHTDPFACRCLYRYLMNLDPKRLGNICPHLIDVVPEFWAFEDDRGVNINNIHLAGFEDLAYPAEQFEAADTLVLRVRIRKMEANVSGSDGAQKGVHNGMQEDIAVRMCNRTEWGIRKTDAAENERFAWCQAVNIVAKANHYPSKIALK